jgi:cullin-4
MVERLLNFKTFAEKAANTAFVDYTPSPTSGASTSNNVPQQYKTTPNVEYDYAIRDGLQAGFSKRRNKPAEMIAKYLDQAMRKGQKSATDTEFMSLLEKVLQLYRFTDDKDVFRTYYMRALAKRLLLSRSANDAFEIAVLKTLTDGMSFVNLGGLSADHPISQNMIPTFQREKLCSRIWRFPVTW